MKKTLRRSVLLGAATLATVAAGAFAATPAQAAPTDCTKSVTIATKTASSLCTSGSGEHRVVVTLLSGSFYTNLTANTYYGPWVAAGQTSSVVWPFGFYPTARVETRG